MSDEERDRIRRALERNQGSLSRAAKDLGWSRKTVWQKLKNHPGLAAEADALRAAAGVKGPRPSLPGNRLDPEGERVELQRALEAVGWNAGEAAKALGIGRRTLYTLMKRYDLPPVLPTEAEERAALEAALREGGGTQVGAARYLGVSHTEIQRRMARLGVTRGKRT